MFALAGGFGLVGSSLYRLYDDLRVFSWSQAIGAVTAATIADHVVGYTNSGMGGPSTPVTARRLDVTYDFTTRNDLKYQGTTISRHHSGRDVASAQRRYRVGTRVTVFYDASDPARAVLERRVSLLPVFGLLLGIPLLMLSRWARTRTATIARPQANA